MRRRMLRGLSFALIAYLLLVIGCGGGGGGSDSSSTFEVLIENVSSQQTFSSPSGRPLLVVFSPGAFVIHRDPAPIFSAGEPARSNGLESLAEDGDPGPLARSLQFVDAVSLVGIVMTPVGEETGGALVPGKSYRTVVRADRGESFSIALGFLQSNDLFIAPQPGGIPLFDGTGSPVSGDFTSQFTLWDAGTEVNEAPGEGPNQPPTQPQVNTGPSEGGTVRPVSDGFDYPAVSSMVRVTIRPIE